ncbi:MAG: hypothetical protein KDB53_10090 [Planctomycetes bacterium]|nr:hypothetical protein [Planctomycetota bacterium]
MPDFQVEARFADHADRKVELRVRNTTQNEDEDGKSNLRSGHSNDFIFPGKTGADASGLQGIAFKSVVSVRIPTDATKVTSAPFALAPHSHGPDDHHH